MTIKQFAEKHKLHLKRDADGDMTIPGRRGKGSHIYEHGANHFGAMCLFDSARIWNRLRDEGKAKGLVVHQDGDREGCLLFNPGDESQGRFAIEAIKAKRKRKMAPPSEAQLEARARFGAARKTEAVTSKT